MRCQFSICVRTCMCCYAEMFGISDHDLMFTLQANKAVEDDAEIDDENNERFILDKVCIVITLMHICY